MDKAPVKHTARENMRLFRRFLPYFKPRLPVLLLDLFCASLTTICDLVLPLIVRYITSMGATNLAALTVSTVVKLSLLYVALRVVDTAANYFMQSVGHVMGTHIETDMRRDLFAHLQELPHAYYSNTKIGQLMSRITSDLFDITEFAHHFPEEVFITGIKVVIAFVILCGMHMHIVHGRDEQSIAEVHHLGIGAIYGIEVIGHGTDLSVVVDSHITIFHDLEAVALLGIYDMSFIYFHGRLKIKKWLGHCFTNHPYLKILSA